MIHKCLVIGSLMLPVVVSGAILQTKDVNPDGYVLLVSTSNNELDANVAAQKIASENVYIYKDNDKYTVRIVNLSSKVEAAKKLSQIKSIFKDAIHWKKMTFLKDVVREETKTSAAVESPQIVSDESSKKVQPILKENKEMNFELSSDGQSVTQLIRDTKVYSGPEPYNNLKDEFKQGYYLKGMFSENKNWFIIMQISTNKNTWFDIPSPLWMKLNEIN